jgi:hypothetical protein
MVKKLVMGLLNFNRLSNRKGRKKLFGGKVDIAIATLVNKNESLL